MNKNPMQIRTKLSIEDKIEFEVLADLIQYMKKRIEFYVSRMKASGRVKAIYYETVTDDLYTVESAIKGLMDNIKERKDRR